MNAISKQFSGTQSRASIFFDLAANAPHVFVSEIENDSEASLATRSKRNIIRQAIHFVSKLMAWLIWLAQASIVRSVAPGVRSLERHEFENLESRRGGFGNVF
jgi:hypothetical protein